MDSQSRRLSAKARWRWVHLACGLFSAGCAVVVALDGFWWLTGIMLAWAMVQVATFSQYGHLRLAELPGLFWILLAGRSERARLRKAVARRRHQQVMSPVNVLERDVFGEEFAHGGVTGTPRRMDIGPLGLVRPCCGTTPGTGHRGTCPKSLMNGGTTADIAREEQFATDPWQPDYRIFGIPPSAMGDQ